MATKEPLKLEVPAMGPDFEILNKQLTRQMFADAGHDVTDVTLFDLSINIDKGSKRRAVSQQYCHSKKHLDTTVGGRWRKEYDVQPGCFAFDEHSDFDGAAKAIYLKARAVARELLVGDILTYVLRELKERWANNLIFRVKAWTTVTMEGHVCKWKMSPTEEGQKMELQSINGKTPLQILVEKKSVGRAQKYMRDIANGLGNDLCTLTETKTTRSTMCVGRAQRLGKV